MSLYHEAAEFLVASPSEGGSLKARIFRKKGLKSPPSQLYAIVLETAKWSGILKEVIEKADVLRHERKLTPALSLLLTHDLLISKGGVALAKNHGLRQTIERHKGRLSSELTLARLRRKISSITALKEQVDRDSAGEEAKIPRWVRVNALKSSIEEQLETTFSAFELTSDIKQVISRTSKTVMIDPHVPNLLAVTQGTDLSKTEAYTSGKIILQDKASCFPAYLLDPRSEDGDVVDACAAPGNKTTHLAAIIHAHRPEFESAPQRIYACEKDSRRALILEKMVGIAGSKDMTRIGRGQDFLQVNPMDEKYKNVGALLLDPSCSGSGIVGRDSMPEIYMPEAPTTKNGGSSAGNNTTTKGDKNNKSKKRKAEDVAEKPPQEVLVDDDGNEVVVKSKKDLKQRLESLAAFQLLIIEHAFSFPAARKITYSTCSVHAEENEEVVIKALRSEVGQRRGWRVMRREEQVVGMREWPVRGVVGACEEEGDKEKKVIAEACVRSYKDDGHGVMGFFVAGFVRDESDGDDGEGEGDDGGPYERHEDGSVMRDGLGMPVVKATGVPVRLVAREDGVEEGDDDDNEGDEWGGFDD